MGKVCGLGNSGIMLGLTTEPKYFSKKAFRLIDFGSAADMDAAKKLFDFRESAVALSPVYAAPECYIEWDK